MPKFNLALGGMHSKAPGKRAAIAAIQNHGYPGHEAHEARAWSEWIAKTGATFDVIGHGPEQLAVRMT